MPLPFPGEFHEFFDRLALKRFFNFVDASDRRADAAHFALVLAADDFLENPLDHIRWGRGGFDHREGGNTLAFAGLQALVEVGNGLRKGQLRRFEFVP